MNYHAHLVVVSGVPVQQATKEEDPKTFLTQKFPRSLVDEFCFLDNSSGSGRLLYQRSKALLEQLWKSRGASTLPIIILAHGLGGFVVKQALVSATEEPRYQDIALNTVKVIFFGAAHNTTRNRGWGHLYLSLLSAVGSLPDYPLKLVHRIVGELEDINASFRTLSCSFDVTNFNEGHKYPVLDKECSILGRQDEVNVNFDCRHESLWRFTGEVAKEVCKQVIQTQNSEHLVLRNILRRLSLLDSQTHQLKPLLSKTDSLDWVCDGEAVHAWKNDPTVGILHIPEPSGVGASGIAAHILGSLLNQTEKKAVFISFEFDKNNIRAQSSFSFLLSFCRQLLSALPQLFEHISSASDLLSSVGAFTTQTLWTLIHYLMTSLVSERDFSLYCIIDSVDECIASQSEVIECMEELVKLANGKFKLLLSGITIPESKCDFTQHLRVTITPHSEGMTALKERYVRETVRKLAIDNPAWYGLEDTAVDHLKSLPLDSPYLLVKLNMALLEWTGRHSIKKDIKSKLDQQPTSIEGFYSQVMGSIDSRHREFVTKALFWIATAVRPLRPTELAMAVALDDISWNVPLPDNIGDLIRKDIVGDLTRIVAPLVKSENNRLYLIHDTLWDFLQERFSQVADPARGSEAVLGTPLLTHKHVSGDMHYRILVQCLEYSGNLGPSDSTSVPLKHAWLSFPVDEKNGLLSYAPFYWPRHYLKTSSREAAHAYVLQFFRNDEMFEKWSNLYQHFKSQTQSNRDRLDHPLKVVCSFGLADLFEDCFTMVRSSERHGNQLSESLDLAARRGYGDMVRMLLERGVRSQDALGNAALEGYDDIVDNLLDAGSNVNEVDGSGFAPIHYATCSGHKRTVALLLAKGADPNALTTLPQDRVMLPYETSPIDQTQEGDISDDSSEFSESSDTVTSEQSLVQTENVVYRHRAGAETSLHFAALTGQVEIAQLLLANGAKVDAQNDFEYDPLKFAAEGGFPELLTLLLDNQAAADNESSRDGNTAMHLAVACGHSKAAEILLARSSNAFKLIHKVNTEGLSPMHIVARDGRLKLLSLMLRVEDRHREADSVSSVNSNSQSASPVAISPAGMRITHRAHTGQQPIRRSTFGRPPERKGPLGGGDTQIFSVDKKHCKSVLELAAQNGHPRIVHKLLKRSWLVGTQDIGRALVLTAEQGHANIVTALLDRNSSKAASDTSKALALHAAAKAGHPKTVEALLTHRRGPRLSEMDKVASKGMTPLHEAAKGGHADVVKTLLEHKGTPNDLDDSLRTALHYAAASGSLECVQVLLQTAYKVDGRLRDKRGRTALHFAARRGHLPIVRRLCQVKDMIWTKDRDDLTAFDWVVDRDIPEEVETFIRILEDTAGQGAEFERGGLPLHVTVERRNISILRLLLQKGWKCNTRDTKGVTPFLKAVMKNFDEGVDLLLQDELCEVNARDDEDCNALHYVESPKLARKLLQLGVHNEHKDRKGQTPLFAAAWGSHIEVVRVIMESTPRPDPHIRDEDGWTVLHAAYDCPSILGLMLENKVDPNVLNSDGRTALAMSIEGDHFDCAKLLLEAQADPNLADEFENSPLCVAFTSTSCIEWLKLLSDNGVNLLAQSTSEITALHLAAEKNELELFTYLVERMESVDTTRVNEIFGSVLCHYVAMLDFNQVLADMLVSRGLDVNRKAKSQLADYELTALYAACRQGRSETVEWLLQHGADVNLLVGEGRSPLGASFRSLVDSMAKVYLLLAKEANVNHVGTMEPTALQQATSLGNKALITLLLDKGADPNLAGGQRDTPLNIAIRQKLGSDIVLSIISKGADLSQAGKHGILPAGTAAGADQVSILQLLAEKGVDPLAKDIHGRTALMHAVIGHSVDAVSYLLANKMISVSEVDAKGQTPLIVAAVLGDKAIVKVLLEKGFSDPKLLNAQDYRGKTALACAVSSNHLDVVVTLLGNDASPHVVDCRGRSPLYWAAREAGLEVMETMITSLDRKDHEITAYLNVALHGAVAAGRLGILQMLLKRDYVNVNHREPDGWSPLYTAQIYGRTTLVDKLRDARAFHSSEAPGVKMPSRWHLHDRFPALELGPEGTSLRTNGGSRFLNLEFSNQCFGAARTDYPMVPLVDDIYYFEIQIRKASTEGGIAIGFCDDHAPLYDMLGWHTGSWGFHSRSGCLYANDERSWEGIPYSEPYGQGDVIGCGLNFAKRNGFYTRNGKVIGRSFPRAIGKLYPAVSMDICNGVWEISAVFPDDDGRSARFMFQGSFGEETLRQVERKEWDNETPE